MLTIKMNNNITKIPFKMEFDEETVELEFTQYTVADAIRMNDIQVKFFGDEESDLTEAQKDECISLARIVTCVKNPDGSYYWDNDVTKLLGFFGGELFYAMLGKCSEVNPSLLDVDETKLDGETITAAKKN